MGRFAIYLLCMKIDTTIAVKDIAMSLLRHSVLLLAAMLALPVLADDQVMQSAPPTTQQAPVTPTHDGQVTQTESSTVQQASVAPTRIDLFMRDLDYRTLIRRPGDSYSLSFRETHQFRPFHTDRVLIGTSLCEGVIQPDPVAFAVRWFPTSLYIMPFAEKEHFTKTGALTTRRTTETTTTYPSPETKQTTITTRIIETEDPETTTYTYTRCAVYGVITANFNHIFDFGDSPFRTENARVGVGVTWADHHNDIPDGVTFDRTKRVKVKTHAIQLERSIEGGDPTWYLSYVRSFQE